MCMPVRARVCMWWARNKSRNECEGAKGTRGDHTCRSHGEMHALGGHRLLLLLVLLLHAGLSVRRHHFLHFPDGIEQATNSQKKVTPPTTPNAFFSSTQPHGIPMNQTAHLYVIVRRTGRESFSTVFDGWIGAEFMMLKVLCVRGHSSGTMLRCSPSGTSTNLISKMVMSSDRTSYCSHRS